ncbi:hypothetical protein [Bartonella gliris]|uniref:hypothetical protein n=1 Tax=Bartonella gliris TaxID=3004109 RepID=UPI0038734036
MRVGRGVLGGLGVVFWFGCFFGGAVAGGVFGGGVLREAFVEGCVWGAVFWGALGWCFGLDALEGSGTSKTLANAFFLPNLVALSMISAIFGPSEINKIKRDD